VTPQVDAVLLDTDVFSYLLRTGDERGKVYQKHVEGKTLAISFVTVGELFAGAYKRWGQKRIAGLEARLKAWSSFRTTSRSARRMLV